MKKETRDFYKNLSILVLPLAFQNLMAAMVGASDALMLGMLDQDSLSAVSLAVQVQFVLFLFHTALTSGTTILAAQYWGIKDKKSVESVLAISLKTSCFISFVFFLTTFLFPNFLMGLLTNDNTLILSGAEFLKSVCWSYLLIGVSQIYLCIMKNSGRTLKVQYLAPVPWF